MSRVDTTVKVFEALQDRRDASPTLVTYWDLAEAAVAALLPQITAVEEIEALSTGTIFEDRLGWAWVVSNFGTYRAIINNSYRSAAEIRARGPITVVRTP